MCFLQGAARSGRLLRSNLAFRSLFAVDWKVAEYALPFFCFVALYSKLPHKELRFLLPGLPLLHLAAGSGLAKLVALSVFYFWGREEIAAPIVAASKSSAVPFSDPREGIRHRKGPKTAAVPSFPAFDGSNNQKTFVAESVPSASLASKLTGALLACCIFCAIATSASGTALFIRVAMDNYPGGSALQQLYTLHHDVEKKGICSSSDVVTGGAFEWWRQCFASSSFCPARIPITLRPCGGQAAIPHNTVHIDVAAAVSGVSRFAGSWSESWVVNKTENLRSADQYANFDFLITEDPEFHAARFEIVERVNSFSQMRWFPTPHIIRRETLAIMQRRKA
jgi:hypothetical protein